MIRHLWNRAKIQARPIKELYYISLNFFRFFQGFREHLKTGKNTALAYQSMITCFCKTRGLSNDFFSKLISLTSKPYRFPNNKGILGDLSQNQLREINLNLSQDGYYVFPNLLSKNICDELEAFARSQECEVELEDANAPAVITRYDETQLQGVRYSVPVPVLISHPSVQKLLCDYSLLSVAQTYLGAPPIMENTALSWSTPFNPNPSKRAAQFYHFDMDRIKWLKLFIYITDVGPKNGPHSFVRGSHRRFGIPDALLKQGYSRLTDEEVGNYYPPEDFLEFTGARGTMIFEDTRGLHKGKNLDQGHRLMLGIQFSNSAFGGHTIQTKFTTPIPDFLKAMISQYPQVYSLFS